MRERFSLGVDFGTSSVRALIVNTSSGEEVGTAAAPYASGKDGILLDPSRPVLARQHPRDYLTGLEACIRGAVEDASKRAGSPFDTSLVIGMGVDTTGSTPIPVDADGIPLAFDARFEDRLAAMAWLWKDHTGHAEAARITASAPPRYLAKCGGTYSSEWFWAKVWHCLAEDAEVFEAAHTWVEHADWIPALLTGTDHPSALKRGICAAGHKALFHQDWGGYPESDWLRSLDPALVRVRTSLPNTAYTVGDAAGELTEEWATRLGLPKGVKVAVGAFDAHLGGIGSGIQPGTLVKIIGTSTCDIMTAPLSANLPDIPGLCGIVPESVLPGSYGLEAGQSGVGDIFNWFVDVVKPGGEDHESLTEAAIGEKPGQSGLLALDWHNGNRTVLVDQRLTGLILGLTTHSNPAQIYRALIEATAFGARTIIERFEAYGVEVNRVVNCGGISVKNRLLLQIYADVLDRPMYVSRSTETCALGSAIAGSVVAGAGVGGHATFSDAVKAMTAVRDEVFHPIPEHVTVYNQLFALYTSIHDAFGVANKTSDLGHVMKRLLDIRDEVNRSV